MRQYIDHSLRLCRAHVMSKYDEAIIFTIIEYVSYLNMRRQHIQSL
jgi:hypothetical protein